MQIAARLSFAKGEEYIAKNFPDQLAEIESAIRKVDAAACRTKRSKEKTMPGKILYHPPSLNKAFKDAGAKAPKMLIIETSHQRNNTAIETGFGVFALASSRRCFTRAVG